MNDPTRLPRQPPGDEPGDPVARLVRLGGARPAAPDDRRARVRQRVHDLWSETVKRDRRRRRVLIAARLAAALVIVTGAGLWLWQRGLPSGAPAATVERADGRVRLQDNSSAGTGRVLPAGARVITAPDGMAALRLIDGASVRLDIATELRLISPRVLELRRGAVYVDSGASAPGTSLEIRTPLGQIRDVGTQFEVRLANDRLRLSVREGAAALTRDHQTYSIPAGESLRVDRNGTVETGAVAPRDQEWAWTLAVAPLSSWKGARCATISRGCRGKPAGRWSTPTLRSRRARRTSSCTAPPPACARTRPRMPSCRPAACVTAWTGRR